MLATTHNKFDSGTTNAHRGWVPHHLLDQESMREQVVKLYVRASLPTFQS